MTEKISEIQILFNQSQSIAEIEDDRTVRAELVQVLDGVEKYLLENKASKINPSKIYSFLEKYEHTLPDINSIISDYFLRTDIERAFVFIEELFENYRQKHFKIKKLKYLQVKIGDLKIENLRKIRPVELKNEDSRIDFNIKIYLENLQIYFYNFQVLDAIVNTADFEFLRKIYESNITHSSKTELQWKFTVQQFKVAVSNSDVEEIFNISKKISNLKYKNAVVADSSKFILEGSTEETFLDDLKNSFRTVFSAIYKIPNFSPLHKLLEINEITEKGFREICSTYDVQDVVDKDNEIVSRVEIPPSYIKHTIFICPIQKELCFENNPPVLLSCSHVISKESAENISMGGNFSRPLNTNSVKCPYCHVETTLSKIRTLKLS